MDRNRKFRLTFLPSGTILFVKGRPLVEAVQPKLLVNLKENRHLAEWRFSLLIRILTTHPKMWNVTETGNNIASPPFGWCS